ncbi:hypothetical protein ACDX78_03800 [Virgibacillus oceani]
MNIGDFIPFIILLVLSVLVILGVRWFSRRKIAKKGYWMLGGYGIILLISVIIYYFIPVSTEETAGIQHPDHWDTFSSVISGADSVASIEEYLVEEWEFDYEEDTLRIASQGENNYDSRIAVERTENETIEAAFYRTPLYFQGREVEIDSRPVYLQMTSDRLELIFPESTEEISFASFSKEFPMQQFKDKEMGPFGYAFGFGIKWSEQLIYLQIPEDMEISTGPEVHVEYLN